MFICFTGMDGSGKSTLARQLATRMAANGRKSQYIYCRFRPRLIKPLALVGHALFLRNRDIRRDYSGYSGTKRALFRNRFLAFVYERLLLLDYCLQALIKVGLPLSRGRSIVCDRYIYDTVVTDLAADMGYSPEKIGRILRGCFRMLPRPDVTFLIDTPEEIAFKRKDDIPSLEYLKDRRSIYRDVARQQGMVMLDGAKDLPSLTEEIWTKLEGPPRP